MTVVLGLRPFTSKAHILPEQAVGRGLRLMQGISPDSTQTLEVMGTKKFEDFVRELEREGVGIKTVTRPPKPPVKIEPVMEKGDYDIAIPFWQRMRPLPTGAKRSRNKPVFPGAIYGSIRPISRESNGRALGKWVSR